jgi:UDP-N-acetylmuramoyl-tripeptide--D-alanyl-D-alanine ligase
VQALPADGIAVLNFDDPHVKEFGEGMGDRAIFYGTEAGAQVRAEKIEEAGIEGMRFDVIAKGERAHVELKLLGRHNVLNALAAIAVGLASGMTLQESAAALRGLEPGDKRGEVLSWHGATLINDCYNSNPRALDAMVDALMAMPGSRHIIVAGEMLELGEGADALHAACGRNMAEHHVSLVIGVRGHAAALVDAAANAGVEAMFMPSPEEAGTWLKNNLREQDVVLLKASRGVRLERALAVLGD